MINTVLGEITPDKLGVTLMHEHIVWDWDGAESNNNHNLDKVVNRMLPFLLDLKKSGCDTLVEATTFGAGRDISILGECAKKSGLNIITNTGVWDGSDSPQKYTPNWLKRKKIDEIVEIWSAEYFKGIEGTQLKPAFIKIALGDTGEITEFQDTILRAAARTSLKTKMPVQCHTFSASSAIKAVSIIEEETLPFNKFIWVHADGENNINVIKQLAEKGIWVEFDCLARTTDFSWHVQTIKTMVSEGMLDRLLLSQDAGTFYFGEENTESSIFPYSRLFKEFIPSCVEQGISHDLFDELLIKNPLKVLDIN